MPNSDESKTGRIISDLEAIVEGAVEIGRRTDATRSSGGGAIVAVPLITAALQTYTEHEIKEALLAVARNKR